MRRERQRRASPPVEIDPGEGFGLPRVVSRGFANRSFSPQRAVPGGGALRRTAPQRYFYARDLFRPPAGGLAGGQSCADAGRLLHGLPDRDHDGLGLRADRTRLHARLRDPAADQLRPRRRLCAQRPVLDHDHSFRSGPQRDHVGAWNHRGARVGARDRRSVRGHREYDHRVRRLSPTAPGTTARCADHGRRHVVHRPERLAGGLRRELPQPAAADPGIQRLQDRQRHVSMEPALRRAGDHPGPAAAHLACQVDEAGQGDAGSVAGSRRRGDHGSQREPHDLVHVRARRRPRRRRRPPLPDRVQHPLRHGLRARPDRVHRGRARRDRQPRGRRPGCDHHRADPGFQRRPRLGRAGERLDPLDRLRAPDRDPRLPPGGPARRTDSGGGVTVKGRLRQLNRLEPLDPLFATWRRLPHGLRGAVPAFVVIVLAATYPYYVSSLPTDVPVILSFPDVGAAVTIVVFVIMAVGLNIVVGYAGLLDLGYVAFYAIGAYTAGWLASGQFQQVKFHFGSVGISSEQNGIHISVWLVLLFAALLTAVGGILIGLPTLRLRGDYLAIVTLGFGEIIPQFVRNADSLHGFDLTHGTFGISPIDPPGFGHTLNSAIGLPVRYDESFPPTPDRLFFWTVLGLILLTLFCSMRLRDSRLGRAWIAIREDETAAGAMGIPLMRTKTWAYASGAFFGGMAGAYIASSKSNTFPGDFLFQISVFILCMVVLGGMVNVWGVIVGAAFLAYLNYSGLGNTGARLNSHIHFIGNMQLPGQSQKGLDVPEFASGIYGLII